MGEDVEEEDQEEEEEDMGEMKAKFDKIMANFMEDSRGKRVGQGESHEDLQSMTTDGNQNNQVIASFKNKNIENNMKGIF